MEMIDYVSKLQSLLKQHDRAIKQILKINDYISDISRQAFHAAMYGTSQQAMQLLLRKSIAEGVKIMYKRYRLKKWLKIQLLIQRRASIISHTLNSSTDQSSWASFIQEHPDLNLYQSADPWVQGWAVMHCEFSRYS